MEPRVPDVLLVEDNPGDVTLLKHVWAKLERPCRLHVVSDGAAALVFLRREGEHADAVRPDLMLLDLNLPRMDGREVLSAVKSDPALRTIPVVMITSSENARDISECYALGANCYIVKPMDFPRYVEVVTQLEAFWLRTARLPSPSAP